MASPKPCKVIHLTYEQAWDLAYGQTVLVGGYAIKRIHVTAQATEAGTHMILHLDDSEIERLMRTRHTCNNDPDNLTAIDVDPPGAPPRTQPITTVEYELVPEVTPDP